MVAEVKTKAGATATEDAAELDAKLAAGEFPKMSAAGLTNSGRQ